MCIRDSIGIMLSAAMICASTTLVSSMQNFVLRCAIHIDGDWYGAVYDAAYKDLSLIHIFCWAGISRSIRSTNISMPMSAACPLWKRQS